MYNFPYFPRQRWILSKLQEKNFIAAFFHMSTITLTCASMAQLGWFHIRGRDCPPHLAVYQFFSLDTFQSDPSQDAYAHNKVNPCITREIANSMRIIILLCFMAMISSFIGFFLDLIGPTWKFLKMIKRNALPSIFTVIWIVMIISVCYYITILFESADPLTHIKVSYEYGTYTITTAGFMAIFATASNLLQQQNVPDDPHRRHLVEDWDGIETFSVGGSGSEDNVSMRTRGREDTTLESIASMQPPPPYTP